MDSTETANRIYGLDMRRKNACGFALMDSDAVTIPLVATMGLPKLVQAARLVVDWI